MIFPPVLELAFVGLYEAGVPNQERIVLRPSQPANLSQFGIVLTLSQGLMTGRAVAADALFWFPEQIVSPPDWVYVFTGSGQHWQTAMPNGEKAFVYHWGRPNTIFTPFSTAVLPTVIRVSAITNAVLS